MANPVVPIRPELQGEAPASVFLQPIAAPSILGLYGFAGATFVVAANMAHWFGNDRSGLYLAPFAAFFGGLAQFSAGMWSYKARDGIATAMHGMWGAFWMAYGILNLGFASGTLTKPTGAFPALGFWFIALGAITWAGFWASTAENVGLSWVLGLLAVGSTIAAVGELLGSGPLVTLAGWVFIASAIVAWYVATALMLEGSFRRPVLPVGKTKSAREAPKFASGVGEPGVIHGQ